MNSLKKFFAVVLSSVLVFSACGTGGSTGEKVLRVVDTAKPITLNHHDTSISVDFNQIGQIMENLVDYDVDRHIVGAAAESWEASNDNLTYTFKIRKDAKWSDGSDLTAGDFEYAWKKLATTPTSPYSNFIDIIKNGKAVRDGADKETLGVKATDDKTLVVDLEKQSALFLAYMAFPVFAPMKAEFYDSVGAEEYGKNTDAIIGNGAYKIESFIPEQEVIFVKNENYWDAKSVDVDRVEFRVVTEPATQAAMFENNEIDVLDAKGILAEQFKDYKNLVPYNDSSTSYMYLSNDTLTPSPALANKDFRLAIAYAIDKSVLTEQIRKDNTKVLDSIVPFDFGEVGDGKFYSDLVAASDRDVPTFNEAKAKEHLDAAKAALGSTPLEFSLNFMDNATNKLVFENIKSQVETKLPGVTLNLNYVPSQLFYPDVKAFKVPAASAGWGADYFDYSTFFVLITPDGNYNYGKYNNPEIGKLLEEAESPENVNNAKKRAELYFQAETLALQDGRIIPLYQTGANYALKDNVKNYQRNAMSPHVSYKNVKMS